MSYDTNNMKLKPLGDHVIVKPITEDEITKSGIVLPDTIDKEKLGMTQDILLNALGELDSLLGQNTKEAMPQLRM